MENKISEIVNELKTKNEKLASLAIYEGDGDYVYFEIAKYHNGENGITEKQMNCIKALTNVSCRSNSTLRQMNKWCASAIIDAAKTYPNVEFYISK